MSWISAVLALLPLGIAAIDEFTRAIRVDEEYVFPSLQTWVVDLNPAWFLTE